MCAYFRHIIKQKVHEDVSKQKIDFYIAKMYFFSQKQKDAEYKCNKNWSCQIRRLN